MARQQRLLHMAWVNDFCRGMARVRAKLLTTFDKLGIARPGEEEDAEANDW